MLDDLHNNGHLFVFQGGDPHEFLHNVDPETGLNENEKFRAVHDVFGHGLHGNPFGAKGEENAWAIHSQMYSPLARLAMTAETRGQNSFVNYTPINAMLKEQLAEIESRLVDARRNRNEFGVELLQKKKKELFKDFQFAPQKALLLPPEYLDMNYQGGMPEYIRSVIRPEEGTYFSSPLTHYSTIPDMEKTDPSRYGTGIPGDEASRLRSMPGAVKDRSYFYLGEPGEVPPEEGLGPYRYRGEAERLYDITKDPMGFKTLARESNRMPWSSNFNPGMVDPGRFANDIERLTKEYGYQGFANPNAAFPMAVTFDPTQVERRAAGGEVGGNFIPHDDPKRQENFANWFGYSHVVDESGNPVVLYHGTDADFDEFDPGKAGQTDHGWYGEGHYLTANPETASAYSGYKNYNAISGEEIHPGQNVMPVHVRLENPYYWPHDRPAATSKEEARKITEELRKQGYDGVIAPNKFEDDPLHAKFSEVVVFTPHQMKSATGNNGNYNMRSARLNEAAGGEVESDTPYHQTPEFQNWFGDSVTHNEGVPITYYHGTSKDADFPSFKVGRHGIWMTTSPAEASEYAAQNDSQNFKYEGGKYVRTNTASRVIPVHIKAENPYRGDRPDFGDAENYKKLQSDWFDTLRRQGYDSWIPDIYKGGIAVVLKDPTQIKSIYNRKFDPKNKRMDKGAGGPAIAKLRQMSDPAVNKAIRAINKSGSSPRDAVTLSKRLLGRQ